MHRRPFASLLAVALVAAGPAQSAWAAKKPPATTTTTLSPRELRIQQLRDLVGEASDQEAGLLTEIADIESRLDGLDKAVTDLTRKSAAAQRRFDAAQGKLRK